MTTERKHDIMDDGKISAAIHGIFDVLEEEDLTVTECIIACRAVYKTFEAHYSDVVRILDELNK